MSTYFLKLFFMYARPIPVQTKVHFKNLPFLAVSYDMGVLSESFLRCLNGSLFPLFNLFLKTEKIWSQPVIVRECIFKNQNLCFAPR